MSERTYGAKVMMAPNVITTPGGNPELRGATPVYRDTADIAKDIRADLKTAVASGALPGAPVTYSVQTRKFAGGSAIDITVKGLTDRFIYGPLGAEDGSRGHTPDCKALLKAVNAVRQAYNYDGSDVQSDYFDVNFYGSVDIQDQRQTRWEISQKAEKAAKKALKGYPGVAVARTAAGPGAVAATVSLHGQVLGRISSRNQYGALWFATPTGSGVIEARGSRAEATLILLPVRPATTRKATP